MLSAGRIERAGELIDAFQADVDALPEAPHRTMTLHRCRAMWLVDSGRPDLAMQPAHEALELAHATGAVLMTIDSLETIGALEAGRGAAVTAARLFGAASAARQQIGYRRRLTPHPDDLTALMDAIAAEHADAFAAGAALTPGEALELARRSRGERGRPTHGWASLTPTEERVTELAAQGQTNQQIAATLLMSTATVKTHLTHVFTKLDITNRTELASAYLSRRASASVDIRTS
jgi:DNA-binding CsgD family transcriptional regulator